MSEELKPCPFCGGEADYRTIGNCVYIKCINCGCTTQTYHYKEKNDAINAWNRRHSLWHTGEPIEEGWYLCKYVCIHECKNKGRIDYYTMHIYIEDGFRYITGRASDDVWKLIEWQKIED